MSEVKFDSQNNQKIAQSKAVPSAYYTCPCSYTSVTPAINNTNNNGYIPAYQTQYYTSDYGYKIPSGAMQYPTMSQTITQPAVNGVTPGATIQAGGTTCEVPQGANGLNIIINSPTVAAPHSNPMINTNTNCMGNGGNGSDSNAKSSASAAANAGANNQTKKTKNVVALTDSYIKNLENYLRSPNKEMKLYAIKQIAERFQEDESRKANPSLNALLNLALQAKEPETRFVALALLNNGTAGGNDVTAQILNNLQQSKILNGIEADDAKKALLKMSETVVKIPDNSPDKPKSKKEDDY